jgi:phage portal protein BeeE
LSLRDTDHRAVYHWLAAVEADGLDDERAAPAGITQGSIGYGAGGPVWQDAFKTKRAPVPSELVEQYKAVAFSCMQLNANGCARVPLRLYSTTGRKESKPRCAHRALTRLKEKRLRTLPHVRAQVAGDVEIHEVMESPLLDGLDTPNDYFDGNLLIQYIARCLDAVGAAYLVPIQLDRTWAPSEIWPLHAQYVFPVKGSGNTILDHYTYFSEEYRPDEVIRIRNLSLRDPYLSPYAPLHACYEQLGLTNSYYASVENVLLNGARPSLIIGPKGDLAKFGETERRRLEVDVNNQFGRARMGRIWVVDGSFQAQDVSYPPTELAAMEVSQNARLIIANCFDVPVSLLDVSNSNRAVAGEGTHQHQYYGIAPRCVLIATALTKYLARPIEPRLFFAFDDPVQRDVLSDAKVFDIYLGNDTLTPNEVRAEQGRPPVAWGDESASKRFAGKDQAGKVGKDEGKANNAEKD